MTNITSFGSLKYYSEVIPLIQHKRIWKKVANMVNHLRMDMRVWDFVDRENQKKSAQQYVTQSLVDTKLPEEVKGALKKGITSEFGFIFQENN